MLKFNQLSGVNTVTKFKETSRPKVVKVPPPAPPKPMMSSGSSSFDDERENREITFKPINQSFGYNRKPLANQDLYASVLPRRKNLCALCGVEVYLAEQMHIDKLMIHKKCFKCSYCAQPLRLGNCGLDRTLMDAFGPRWFCQLHINLQLAEKIARIQKNEKSKTSVAVVPPTQTPGCKPMLAGEKMSSTNGNGKLSYTPVNEKLPYNNQNEKIPCVNMSEKFKYANMDTPSMLAKKTMDRIGLRQEKLETLKNPTPTSERIEFECYRSKINNNDKIKELERKSLESSSSNELESSLDDDEIEFVDASSGTSANSENSESEKNKEGYTSTEDEAEDEELWTEFTEVLENTLTKSGDCSNHEISEQQAAKWIETFNKRASLLKLSPKTPDSIYYTPRIDAENTPQFFTPSTAMKSETYARVDADDTLTNITSIPCNTSPTKSYISLSEDKSSMNNLLNNMPSIQRVASSNKYLGRSRSPPLPQEERNIDFDTPKTHSSGLLKAKMFNPLTNSPVVITKSIVGASESQKEASMLDRIRRLKMRNERRATVAIDPAMIGFKETFEEMTDSKADERVDEREKVIQSGMTTMIEIKDDNTSSVFTDSRNDYISPVSKSKMTESEKKKRLRSRTLANGVQKEDLKEAMSYFSPAITASPRNIKRVQKQAEKILKKREHERQRTAQDVQRGLDETENRINEVNSVGLELESALKKGELFWDMDHFWH